MPLTEFDRLITESQQERAQRMPKVKILVVDDVPANLLAMRAVLDHPEYQVVEAASGEEALKHILTTDFALILMDVQMPGMDGFETADFIKGRERTASSPAARTRRAST